MIAARSTGESPMNSDNLMTLHEVAERLGVHYMTAYRYVRTGRLPASKHGAVWQVDPEDFVAFTRDVEASPPRRGSARPAYPTRLEDRLVNGDESGAWSIIDNALASALTPEEVYTEVLSPAMASIGDRWARGELEIEIEHLASSITQRLIGRLGPRFSRRGRKRGTVVIGAPAGDDHGIPTLMMGDLLRARGFNVIDLGANTPPGAFARAAMAANDLVAVGVCATRPRNNSAIVDAIDALAATSDVPVILGGHGVDDETEQALGGRMNHCVQRTTTTQDALRCFESVDRPAGTPQTA
jgi:excisionase family DNA binding protein